MHWARRLFLLTFVMALGTAAVVLAAAAPADAHATLVEAVPADGSRVSAGPATVELHFTEHVSISGDSVRVMGTDGKRVDDGRPHSDGGVVTIAIDPQLEPDTYVVAWRVVSADDHPVHGATTFLVGDGERAGAQTIASLLGDEGDGAWPVYGAIARAVAYAGGLLVVGVAGWWAFVDRTARRSTRNLARVGAVAAAVGVIATIPIQAALSTGLGGEAATDWSLVRDALGSSLGTGALLVVAGVVLVAGAVSGTATAAVAGGRGGGSAVSLSAAVPTAERSRAAALAGGTTLRPLLALAGSAVVAIGFAFSGHTESTDPRAVMYAADVVHVLAAGAWAGGLVLLANDLRATRRGHLSPAAAATRVARFSAVAAVVSIAAAVAGVVLAWGTVRHLDALTSTDYGRALLVKVGVVALVGVAAVYNNRRLVPAVQQGVARARELLWHTVRAEVVGVVIVVIVTAALVNMVPARLSASPGLIEETVPFGRGTAVVQVDPGEAGENALHVYLLDGTGGQQELVDTPVVSFTLASQDIGPIDRTPYRAGPGHYTLDGREMSIPGTWTIEVHGRISQFEEAHATAEVKVR
jgi:copper transport protein